MVSKAAFWGGTNVVVFEFADFEEEDAEFVGNVGDVVIALFAPNRELLGNLLSLTGDLKRVNTKYNQWGSTSSMLLMSPFSILTSWVNRFASSGANAPAVLLRKLKPMLLEKNRWPFVDEGGGAGIWICEAVGARDWRRE
jgi:hypothetical protein